MHWWGQRVHDVAALSLALWAGLTALAVEPGHSVQIPAAAAAADPMASPALTALVMADRPLAFWPLQDRSPAVARDLVGGHDGTGHGGLQVGQVGQGPTMSSAAFDGAASITAPAAGLVPEAVAVSTWLRTPRRAGGTDGTVVDTGGLSIGVVAGHAVALTCATTCVAVRSATPVTDGAWHQVALSVAGSTTTLYVDGRRDATTSSYDATAPAAGGHVVIGRGFHGNLDNVALFAHPLGDGALATQFGAGACPQAAGTAPATDSARATLPALPLHTSGRWVVDAHGARVKLAGVNWYGAEELDRVPAGLQCQSADAIAAHIAADGFNVVRLPWATTTWTGTAPAVPAVAVAANPQLRGRDARAVFDAVVAALGRHGLMVVLDNHVGRADWCCGHADGNALWWQGYDPAHPPSWSALPRRAKQRHFLRGQARWLAAWRAIATRYAGSPQVIGADLRNEPRSDTLLGIQVSWRIGRVPAWADWPRAARVAGNTVLRTDPNLLVIVEGIHFGTDLRGAAAKPVRLAVARRLVYSAHDYAWFHPDVDRLRGDLGRNWGWLLTQGRRWTTPVWVGEFGSCHPDAAGCNESWFTAFRQYLADADIDWAYWSMAGTGARGSADPTTCASTPRSPGCDEGYGVSDTTWAGDASPMLTAHLRALQPVTQKP